jgi:hypothetical protein
VPLTRSAPGPAQLTFDRFALGFNKQFAADPAKILARPGWPRFNPLVFHGMQGEDGNLLLDAIRDGCLRLEAKANLVVADGATLRNVHDSRLQAALRTAHVLLLHDLDGLPAVVQKSLQLLFRERLQSCLLTVATLRLYPGQDFERFCANSCEWGLSVQVMLPVSRPRRDINLGVLQIHRGLVDQTMPGVTAKVPWQCAADVRALGERLLHAAYSRGTSLREGELAMLGTFLSRHPSQKAASGPRRCCRARLYLPPPRGQWPPEDGPTPPSEIVTAEFRHKCVTVELRRCTWQHRLRLQLRADHEGQATAQFDLDVQVRPRFVVKTRETGAWTRCPWGLTAGITWTDGDPFTEARHWIYRALTPLRRRTLRRTTNPTLSKTMTEARARIHDAACAAVAVLDGGARKVVMRYPNHVRAWLYQQLASDTSGRLAQVAQACPGVLTFAYALRAFGRRTGCVRAASRLLRGIIDGRPLNILLDEALGTWAANAGKRVERRCTPDGYLHNWQCLDECQGNERESLLRAQRLLIRRAGAGVPSLTLWLPPPAAFAPEDIPDQKIANARWFRVMKCLRPILAIRNDVRPGDGYNLCMFVSRHALQIHKSKELGRIDYGRTSVILDYARANNHWPKRSTSATPYLAAAETWHQHFKEIRRMAELATETGETLVDPEGNLLPFPEPPCPGWRSGEDMIIPLRTAEKVLAEGNQMHNCVASLVGDALAGRAFLYHGEVGGKPLTIQVAREGDGYRLVAAAGSANAAPMAAHWRRMRAFLAHLRLEGGCGCEAATAPAVEAQQIVRV